MEPARSMPVHQDAETTSHRKAVIQAIVVTFLWSTSWVLIKMGLGDIPPLTFAGLRYTLAALLLIAWGIRQGVPGRLARLPGRRWLALAGLGLVLYAGAQGAQFVALSLLPAITVNLLLNFSTIAVALIGMVVLTERPSLFQWGGIALSMAGAVVYFYPVDLPPGQVGGLIVALLGMLATAGGAVLGRANNRRGDLSPLEITTASMSIGGPLMLLTGILVQGLPPLSLQSWLIIVWLAVVNTAFAFTLWNLSLRTLTAVESNTINNTMIIQIPILAVIFLGESFTLKQLLGLALVGLGTWLVQRKRLR